ncbi:hypothetical protein QOL99_05295 [Deinococcus sp. MIMF12]|uniref:Uncharacterized protein n=1 Tax=Deinococcus rhizophilus TaxID=3049544 RepID=A0ABT7JGE2_9DEIO|nr:hypothetical protein [Deinococcus rhizophilus]MDL2343563.1 hypothetical protein [Deinococcus rhizophilus]
MTDPRDGRPDEELQRQTPMPVNERTGQPDSHTGFQTHDPKDTHQGAYTTTPTEDRVASADEGKGVTLPATDPAAVTHQFDHLATRNPEAMAHELETPEFAGAQTIADIGVDGALLDRVIPAGVDAGVSASVATNADRLGGATNPNPGYVPPSQRTVPHVGEQPGDLPSGAPAELRDELDGR